MWKLIPIRSIVSSSETDAKNIKQSKDRVILLGCDSASGTCKLPLTFIHTSARPRCFKHTDESSRRLLCPKEILDGCRSFLQWFEFKFLHYEKDFVGLTPLSIRHLHYCAILQHSPQKKLQSRDRSYRMILPGKNTSILQIMDRAF